VYRINITIFFFLKLAWPFLSASSQDFISIEQGCLRVSDELLVNYLDSDPDVYETHLVITDVEGSGSVVNVLVYDTSGFMLDQQSYFLPIFGKVNYDPAIRIGKKQVVGIVKIISDGGNIAAQYWQFFKDPSKASFNTAIAVSEGSGADALLCQHFVSDPKIDSRLVFANPNNDSAVTFSLTFFLDRGKQLTKDKYRIAPNGSLIINPYEANEHIIKTGVAYCEVLSGGKITGEYWQSSREEKYQVSLPLEAIKKRTRDW